MKIRNFRPFEYYRTGFRKKNNKLVFGIHAAVAYIIGFCIYHLKKKLEVKT